MSTPLAGRPVDKRRQPLWDRVDANRLRLLLYLVLFALISSIALGFALAITAGAILWLLMWFPSAWRNASAVASFLFAGGALRVWLIGLAIGVGYEVWALARSERWLLLLLDACFVPKGELLDTKFALKDMAIAAGLPVAPALHLMPDASVNAFVYKAPTRRPVLGVTQGLLDRLAIDEQRAVFANLVARLVAGDTLVSSAVASLMAPLNLYRAHRLSRFEAEDRILGKIIERERRAYVVETSDGPQKVIEPTFAPIVFALPLLAPAIVLGEIVAAVQRKSQLTAGEKADAEGMLLLKDPRPMISALEKCVREDNSVAAAGEHISDIFYFWTGLSTDDDSDPEWSRVARIREVLGVEGWVPEGAEEDRRDREEDFAGV